MSEMETPPRPCVGSKSTPMYAQGWVMVSTKKASRSGWSLSGESSELIDAYYISRDVIKIQNIHALPVALDLRKANLNKR